jgi:hypothetical protein
MADVPRSASVGKQEKWMKIWLIVTIADVTASREPLALDAAAGSRCSGDCACPVTMSAGGESSSTPSNIDGRRPVLPKAIIIPGEQIFRHYLERAAPRLRSRPHAGDAPGTRMAFVASDESGTLPIWSLLKHGNSGRTVSRNE